MPMLKLEIPQHVYEQLLIVASGAWRPPVWHAEWLLRRAIQEEAGKGQAVAAAHPTPGQESPATARAEAGV